MLGLYKATKNLGSSYNSIFSSYNSQKIYSTEPTNTVFACINVKARFFSSLTDETLVNGERKDTFLTPLMKRSNNNHSWEQVKSLALSWAYKNGNAYIYTPIDKGLPFAMYVLPSNKIKVKANSEVIEYYEYWNNGVPVKRIYPNEMIHFKRSFTSGDFAESFYLGQPKELQQSLDLMNLEESAVDFVQSFFDADGVAPYILSSGEMLPADYLVKSKQGFNSSIPNNKYHVQAIIDGGLTVEPLAKSSQADGLAVKESEELVNKICRLFGVPRTVLDMDFAGKATANEVIKYFYDSSLSSDVRNWEQTITQWGQQFDPQFTYNVIDYEINDVKADREQEIHNLEYGLSTINEILESRGQNGIGKEGDVRFLKQGLYPLTDLMYSPVEGEKKKTLTYNLKELIG